MIRGISLGVLLLASLSSCGSGLRPREVNGAVANTEPALLPAQRVRLVQVPERPTLQLVRRSGDPQGAVSVAVFPPGGSRHVVLLSALLSHRLESRGHIDTAFEGHALGLVIAQEVSTPAEAEQWVADIYAVLTDPVKSEDLEGLDEADFLRAAAVRASTPSPFGLCTGELGAEGTESLEVKFLPSQLEQRIEELEGIRQASAVSSRIGLAGLGESELLEAVAHAHDRTWPQGEPLDDSWSGEDGFAVISSEGARELRIALRLSDSEAALAGARALRSREHSLHARLAALSPGYQVTEVQVTLRPAGACVGVSVVFDSRMKPPGTDRVAEAAVLVGDEVEATLRRALPEDETTLALLAPQGAIEAAGLAAWTAVRSGTTGASWSRVAEYRAPRQESISPADLMESIKEVRASWRAREVESVSREEFGQSELWMLAASPCGVRPESDDDSGLRALTLSSLAQEFDGRRGVALMPWVDTQGVGLVAHAPPRRGESPERHAERVARALAGAFAGENLDGRAVALARSRQLERTGSDPGRALLIDVLGGGRSSMVQPWGHDRTVATFSSADLERTRGDLVKEPLRIALLLNSTKNQHQAATGAFSQWLASSRGSLEACPNVTPEPAAPGVWTLQTIEEEVFFGAYLGVWGPARPQVGRAVAYLLNRPGGWLDRALLRPGLVSTAEAEYLGGGEFGGLSIRLGADQEQLSDAIHQTRAVLQKVAESGVSKEELALARAELISRQSRVERMPAGRLVQLWLQQPNLALSGEEVDAFVRRLGPAEHRIITVKQRK